MRMFDRIMTRGALCREDKPSNCCSPSVGRLMNTAGRPYTLSHISTEAKGKKHS